jgi:uncharacterized membrane protein YesL
MASAGEKVYATFRNAWDSFWVIWLAQVFWLLLCLPVITIPLAFAGLYTSVHAVVDGETATWNTFFKGIKSHYMPAIRWSLVNLAVVAVLVFYIWFSSTQLPDLAEIGRIIEVLSVVLLVLWFLVNQYTFPFMLAQEKPSYFQALRNSFVMFIKWPGLTFSFTILIVCILALAIAFRFLWVIFAASLPAFLACSCVKYVTEDMSASLNKG